MKKLSYICLSLLAVAGMSSCKEDKDPKIDTSLDYEFTMNEPQFATSFINLATGGTMNFTVSQPNYGLTVAPTYGLQISLTPEFNAITDQPVLDSSGEEHVVPGMYELNLDSQLRGVLVAKMSDIAAGINQLDGIYDIDMFIQKYGGEENPGYTGPLYVRAYAYLGSGTAAQATATVSNVVKLAQVQGYSAFSNEWFLSVPGGANGWNHLPQIAFQGKDASGAAICKGFAVVDGEFKLTDGDWAGAGNWGASSDLTEASGSYSGALIQNSQTNFSGVPTGLYYFYVELTDKDNGNDGAEVGKFTMTPITKITLPGDYNGWDVTSGPLTNAGNYFTWSGSYGITDAGWKFAMNESWDVNLGGDPEELSFDGPNLTLTGGTVTLNLEQYPWNCTVE